MYNFKQEEYGLSDEDAFNIARMFSRCVSQPSAAWCLWCRDVYRVYMQVADSFLVDSSFMKESVFLHVNASPYQCAT
jgi:hypothetical protein